MPLLADRVKESTSTTGTGTLTLLGAYDGYQTFSNAFGSGVAVYYAIAGADEWEVGIGTTGAGTLTRSTVLASSNGGALVPLSAGVKDVFCTYAAGRAVTTSDAATLTNKTIDDYSNFVGANQLHFKIKANENIARGDVLKVVGYNAGEGAVEVMKVSSASDVAVGLSDNALAIGEFGTCVNTGAIFDLNTNAYPAGTILYPNTSGGLTSTKPASGTYQAIAFVLRQQLNNGVLLVEATNPQYVETSSNVGNTLVLRDASGNFSAGTITATLSGNASSATTATTATTATNVAWSGVTSTPTTLSGYGITDGVNTSGSYANPSWLTSLAWSKISSTPTTISGYGITDGVSTSGSYSNPSWITALAGSKISGNITGNAANVTGTVAVANGGTGATDAGTARSNLSVPSTTGSGASGTWGINITGNAATATSATDSTKLPLSGGTMTGAITTPNGTFGIVVGDDSRLADRNIANTLFVEGVQNNDRGYINFSSTTGNALGAINGGNLEWRGNVVLHSGNYNSYSPTLTGNGASGTWNISVTGNAGGYSNYLLSYDNRTASPSQYLAGRAQFGFTSWANNNTAPYADYFALRSYTDGSGGADNLVMFCKSGIGMRIWQQSYGSGTAWSSYVDVLHSSNYGSYALPLSGGTLTGNLVLSNSRLILNTGGSNTYGIVQTHPANNNHMIGLRVNISGSTSSPTYTATDRTTFVEYNDGTDASGWFFVSPHTGTYSEVARITRRGLTSAGYAIATSFGSDGWSSSSPNAAGRIVSPAGAAASWDGGQTGAFKIRLPFRANNLMWRMTVKIYNYNASISQYDIGNYSYADGAYQSAAYFTGSQSATPCNVRFGNDGTYDCVWIGETNSTWSYPVIAVTDFQGGFREGYATVSIRNWDISLVTSFNTVAGTVSPTTKLASSSSVDGNTILHAGNYSSYAFPSASSQLSNTNLNDMTSTGYYYSNTQYGSNSNIPYANYFVMLNLMNGEGRRAQLWFGDTSAGGVWWRPRQGDGTGWHSWEKFLTNANYSSYALPLSGGTLTGSLVISNANFATNVYGIQNTFGVSLSTMTPYVGTATYHPLTVVVSGSEKARFDVNGQFLVGTTTGDVSTGTETGTAIASYGQIRIGTSNDVPLFLNRINSDGTMQWFLRNGTSQGSISVSGSTVSYNAFAGSHWSQLHDGTKQEILRGTVMESLNELCEWPGEENERLPKAKISDTIGSKKVYGVFMAWDTDWETTNDMFVTAVGAFVCRIGADVVVEIGDLLESNGDGTARVQESDVVRASTIGKVTSNVRTHQYDDGSYCVPVVLYCG